MDQQTCHVLHVSGGRGVNVESTLKIEQHDDFIVCGEQTSVLVCLIPTRLAATMCVSDCVCLIVLEITTLHSSDWSLAKMAFDCQPMADMRASWIQIIECWLILSQRSGELSFQSSCPFLSLKSSEIINQNSSHRRPVGRCVGETREKISVWWFVSSNSATLYANTPQSPAIITQHNER